MNDKLKNKLSRPNKTSFEKLIEAQKIEQAELNNYLESSAPFTFSDIPKDAQRHIYNVYIIVIFSSLLSFSVFPVKISILIILAALYFCFRYQQRVIYQFKNKQYFESVFTVEERINNSLGNVLTFVSKYTYLLSYDDNGSKKEVKYSTSSPDKFLVGHKYKICFSRHGQILSKQEMSD